MVVKVKVPNLEKYYTKELEREAIITASQIQTEAKIASPVISGNYRNNIKQNANEVIAEAPYSAKLEFIGKKGVPHSTMRTAARKIAKQKGFKYL
jgi:hypothetical protein